jgi:pimeloyl-ACP methyl ester carboxylesterase
MANTTLAVLRDEILGYYGLDVERRFVDAGGVRTFYLSAGAGRPLVMLHGAGGGGVFWAPVIGRLSRYFRIVVPDVVGYGESDKPDGPYDRGFYTGWLRAFLDAAGLKPAGLVGNSQGGAIALQFAMDHPERTTHLVLVCSAGLVGFRGLAWRAIIDLIQAQLLGSERSTRRLARHLVYDPAGFPLDSAVRYLRAAVEMPGGRRAFLNGRGRAVRPFKPAELGALGCPTLVMWGRQDGVIRAAAVTRKIPAIAGAAHMFMAGAGHTPFIDRPDLFTRHVVEFIRQKGKDARFPG